MTSRYKGLVASLGAIGLVGASALALAAPAFASTTLPYNDPNNSGKLVIENSAGTPITGGNLTDDPTFPKLVANGQATQMGDNKALLNIATPTTGVTPAAWYSDILNGTTVFDPTSQPPTNVGSVGGSDQTLSQYLGQDSVANGGNAGSDMGADNSGDSNTAYQNVYELRMPTNHNGGVTSGTYFTATIKVTKTGLDSSGNPTGTWALVTTTYTATTTAASAASGTAGVPVTLTSTTVSGGASTLGTVTFKDGNLANPTTLGTAPTNAAGVATLVVTPAAGSHLYSTNFAATDTSAAGADASASNGVPYTATAAATPPASLPEAPYALLLPLMAAGVGGIVLMRKRASA